MQATYLKDVVVHYLSLCVVVYLPNKPQPDINAWRQLIKKKKLDCKHNTNFFFFNLMQYWNTVFI